LWILNVCQGLRHFYGNVSPSPHSISAALLHADPKIAVISTICWDEVKVAK